MTKQKSKCDVPQAKKILFVGVNEQIAKLAPIKGLEPPVFMTDIYPGFFCLQNCNGSKWGIISVDQDSLVPDMFAPFHFYIKGKNKPDDVLKTLDKYKSRWRKSLTECGVCIYTAKVYPSAIERVVTYSPAENEYIAKLIAEQPNPCEVSAKDHKYKYSNNLAIARWLNAEEIKAEDIFNGKTDYKLISSVGEKLSNRSGLDLYYTKPDKDKKK